MSAFIGYSDNSNKEDFFQQNKLLIVLIKKI